MSYLPKAPVNRIMRENGCRRISADATDLMIRHMENESKKISMRANAFAKHAGRETVQAQDIRMVLETL